MTHLTKNLWLHTKNFIQPEWRFFLYYKRLVLQKIRGFIWKTSFNQNGASSSTTNDSSYEKFVVSYEKLHLTRTALFLYYKRLLNTKTSFIYTILVKKSATLKRKELQKEWVSPTHQAALVPPFYISLQDSLPTWIVQVDHDVCVRVSLQLQLEAHQWVYQYIGASTHLSQRDESPISRPRHGYEWCCELNRELEGCEIGCLSYTQGEGEEYKSVSWEHRKYAQ
jgi:hypothetical protein